jgi:hypothetical protein
MRVAVIALSALFLACTPRLSDTVPTAGPLAAQPPESSSPPATSVRQAAEAEREARAQEEARRRAEELQRTEAMRRAEERQRAAEAAREEQARDAAAAGTGRGAPSGAGIPPATPQPASRGSTTPAASQTNPAPASTTPGGAPAEPVPPDAETGENVTAAIDRAIARMNWGAIGFEPPTRLRIGDTYELRLVLSPSADEAEVASLVPSREGGAGLQVHHVRFADRMLARLTVSRGSGLSIVPVTPEEQAVSGIEPTTWIWSIEATAAGRQELHLSLDALLVVDGERVARNFRTSDHNITIEVTALQWVTAHLGWILLGLLLAGAGSLAYALHRRGPRLTPAAPARAAAWGKGDAVAAGAALLPAGASHDVFISHSSKDRDVAVQICDALEADGMDCWIAPRDITPGMAWDEAIMDALEGCRVMVLVLSEQSNSSSQVTKEVRNAVESQRVTVVPFRIGDVTLSKALRYHISSAHWLDAAHGPLDGHLRTLVTTVRRILPQRSAPAGG